MALRIEKIMCQNKIQNIGCGLEICKMVTRDRERDRDQIAHDYDFNRDQRLGFQITNRLY